MIILKRNEVERINVEFSNGKVGLTVNKEIIYLDQLEASVLSKVLAAFAEYMDDD